VKPRRLIMQAFGPFAGRQELDFGCLPSDALFLIHGKTGSGKTTVLDAMCYALYGETSGDERDGADMRSHHADPDCGTEVTFEFALGDELFRIRRSPKQERPKVHGAGTTLQNPEAELCRIDPEGNEIESLASKPRNVSRAIVERLGFEANQFRQVVVLPQGRFRDLLAAGSDSRQKILEALFQTAHYRRVERALKEKAVGLRKHAEALTQRIDALSGEAAKQLEFDDEAARTPDALQAGWKVLDKRLQTARDDERTARKSEKRAQEALEAGKAADGRLGELAQAISALATLAERTGEIDRRRATLEAARRAAALVETEETKSRAARARDEAESAVRQTQRAYEHAVAAASQAKASLDALSDDESRLAREEAEKEVTRLGDLREAVGELSLAVQGATDAATQLKSAQTGLDCAATAAQTARLALEQATRGHAEAREAAAPLEEVATHVERAREWLERHDQLTAARTATAEAETANTDAQAAAGEAQTRYDSATAILETARTRRHEARASLLAATLEEGAPCPVCGSLSHPAPAPSTGTAPSEDEMETLEADEKRLATDSKRKAEASAARDREFVQARTLEEGLAQLLGDAATQPRKALEAALVEAEGKHRRAAGAKAALDANARAEQTAQTTVTAASEAEGKAQDAVARARTAHDRATEAQETREAGVPASLRDPQRLESAVAGALKHKEALEAAFEAARKGLEQATRQAAVTAEAHKAAAAAAQKAVTESEARDRAFAQGLRKQAFESAEAWNAARLDEEALKASETSISTHENNVAAARDREVRARTEAQGLERPDLEALRSEMESCDALTRKQAALAVRLDRDAKAVLGLRREIESDVDAREKIETHYGSVGLLARVAEGKNPQKLSLQRFVLASRLEEVLDVASGQLAEMTQGRYRLRRRQAADDLRRAGGLEIDVDDNETGIPRPARTLSGGEGFLAALALSLATAEVVQRHAGGIRLDAIFVDEGFGSLDDEALDRAIRTLMSLHEGGRLVGVISHVPELRERISTRLEIKKTPVGSRAEFVLP